MRILMVLSKSFRTDHRVYKEADTLVRAGHEVTLLEWARHTPDAPAEEEIGGVRVVRVFNRGLLRALPHDALRNPIWWSKATSQGSWLHRREPFDVVHCHDLDTLSVGARLKRRYGIRLVFDAHERFEEMLAGNVGWPIVRAARSLERRLLPYVELLITPGGAITEHYRRVTRVPVVTVRNCFAPPPKRYEAPTEPPFTITYVGVLSRDRLFPEVVPALGSVPGVRLVIGGKREAGYEQVEAAARSVPNVIFLGPVPFADVHPRTRAGHAVLCMLDPENPQYRNAMATKLYDAMSAGRPILTTKGTAMGRFVEKHDVGLTCAYDTASVVTAATTLRDDPAACRRMGEKGLALARTEFHWDIQKQRLLDAYRGLAPPRG